MVAIIWDKELILIYPIRSKKTVTLMTFVIQELVFTSLQEYIQ